MRYVVVNTKIDEDGQTSNFISEVFDNGSDALKWFHHLVDKQVKEWGGGEDGSLNPQVSISKSVDALRYTVSFDLDDSSSSFCIHGLDDDSSTIIKTNLKEEELLDENKFLVVFTPEFGGESMNLYYGESILEAGDFFDSKLSYFDKYKDRKNTLIDDRRSIPNVGADAFWYQLKDINTGEKCGCYIEKIKK